MQIAVTDLYVVTDLHFICIIFHAGLYKTLQYLVVESNLQDPPRLSGQRDTRISEKLCVIRLNIL